MPLTVVCTKAPIEASIRVGDLCLYNGNYFLAVSRPFGEGTNHFQTPDNAPRAITVDFATVHGFEFKPIDAGGGNYKKKWFKQWYVQRHPDWEGFPDQWNLQWAWRWSKKWHWFSMHKSREEANEALKKI